MRIKSNFRDYYDCIGRYDFEPEPIYIRKTSAVTFPQCPFGIINRGVDSYYINGIVNNQELIGFCGKVYRQIRTTLSINGEFKISRCVEDFDSVIKIWGNKTLNKNYFSEKDKKYEWQMSFAKMVEKFFIKTINQNIIDGFFLQHKSPIFVVQNTEDYRGVLVEFNSLLKKYDFYKTLGPEAAYRELTTYWSGIAHPNRPVLEMTNEQKIEAAGFDLRYSFRKDKV